MYTHRQRLKYITNFAHPAGTLGSYITPHYTYHAANIPIKIYYVQTVPALAKYPC